MGHSEDQIHCVPSQTSRSLEPHSDNDPKKAPERKGEAKGGKKANANYLPYLYVSFGDLVNESAQNKCL